jgi:hypothetical protein
MNPTSTTRRTLRRRSLLIAGSTLALPIAASAQAGSDWGRLERAARGQTDELTPVHAHGMKPRNHGLAVGPPTHIGVSADMMAQTGAAVGPGGVLTSVQRFFTPT